MLTEFPYLKVVAGMKQAVGKQDKGTRIYRREGTYKESGEWFTQLDEIFDDQFVSPGGVSMFVPVSRAGVHKRIKEGRLTAFCFHVVHEERTFFGNVRKAKATPFVLIPVSECKAWAEELQRKRGSGDAVEQGVAGPEVLDRDPEDRARRSVRYTDKYLDRDTVEFVQADMKENRRLLEKQKSK